MPIFMAKSRLTLNKKCDIILLIIKIFRKQIYEKEGIKWQKLQLWAMAR